MADDDRDIEAEHAGAIAEIRRLGLANLHLQNVLSRLMAAKDEKDARGETK